MRLLYLIMLGLLLPMQSMAEKNDAKQTEAQELFNKV